MVKNKRGGKRFNSGRKPMEDIENKKTPICVYIPLKKINAIGVTEIRSLFLNLVDLKFEELNKSAGL